MKKIQLRIKFEQKESWRISQISGRDIGLEAPGEEVVSFLLDEKKQSNFQIVSEQKFIFRRFLNCLNRFVKHFWISGRKEKIIQKPTQKAR